MVISDNSNNICWQYRQKNRFITNDLVSLKDRGLSTSDFKICNLTFSYVPANDQKKCQAIKRFIERFEWLQKIPARPTHRFVATYQEIIVGVIIMATPNAFSHIGGPENSHLEKLVARGASASFAPKNLSSWLLMRSISWMVANTQFRYFTAYCDPVANELGTIYQSCNFYYLGKRFGNRNDYFDPQNPQRGWFSDRIFRKMGQYKKYAKQLNLDWNHQWNSGCRMNWESIPAQIAHELRMAAKQYKQSCLSRKCHLKHKYLLIRGRDKAETRLLLNQFYSANPKYMPKGPHLRPGLPYPKVRGQ